MSDDPRPLVGEPLALDLVNTEWADHEGHHDLLSDPAGLTVWLRATGRTAASDAVTLAALRQARAAVRVGAIRVSSPALITRSPQVAEA